MRPPLLSRPGTSRCFPLSSLFCALVITSSSVCPSFAIARTNTDADSHEAGPPHHPDSAHVFNGCHLSTLAYLARFSTEFPGEQGRPLIVRMLNADGQVKPHTMSLVSWHGTWWCRDEYFGVFSLGCAVNGEPNIGLLTAQAERLGDRHARAAMRNPTREYPSEAPRRLTAKQRIAAVTTAVGLIPFPHTIYWVRGDTGEVPVVFFRPAPGKIAVYDPAHGTGVAECASTEDMKIAALVATSMGYRADTIHPDLALASGTLVTAASSTSVTLSR